MKIEDNRTQTTYHICEESVVKYECALITPGGYISEPHKFEVYI